ncbi:MAG TPA: polyprenol phosphomannose-dependent alpha 1,6 mannosyltransferase MptB [Acidimicrobiales bacterium]|nr:polyprenol phosphomannose-dependent alpha 1,6 mannosyltransferase MptB [Acidimicrobiales bacterium]
MGSPAFVQEVQTADRVGPSPAPAQAAWIAVGTLGALGMVLTGTRIGSVPGAGYRWWFTVPDAGSSLLTPTFYLSIAVLVVGWLGVGRAAFAGQLTVRRAWMVLTAWGLPFLLGPPLFSRDLYSYVGQGLVAHRGLDPYAVAPSVLGPGPVLASIASVWRHTFSPYGPFFVAVSKGVVDVAGSSLVVEVLAFRALELIGVALIMVSLPRLARHLGADPGIALWLGALSPLALFGFISSGHNDALMVGLLVAGVTLAVTGRLMAGVALCAAAATVKLPAAAAIVFLVVDRCRYLAIDRRKVVIGQAIALTAAVFIGVTLFCGYGWTWMGPGALHVPTELRILATPSVSVGNFLFHTLHPLGIPVARSATVTVIQYVCALAAVAACLWLLMTLRRHEVVRSTGLALLLIVLGSPTVWPWYLLWGLVLLAATSAQRSKALAAVAALAMLLVGPSGSPVLLGNSYILVSLATVAGIVWLIRGRRWQAVVSGHAA